MNRATTYQPTRDCWRWWILLTFLIGQVRPELFRPLDREHETRGFERLDAENRRRNRFNVALGTDRRGKSGFTGTIDEMMISKSVRYRGPFDVTSVLRREAPVETRANGPPLLFSSIPPDEVLAFGSRRHLFIDDAILSERDALRLVLNKPWGRTKATIDFDVSSSAVRYSPHPMMGLPLAVWARSSKILRCTAPSFAIQTPPLLPLSATGSTRLWPIGAITRGLEMWPQRTTVFTSSRLRCSLDC